MSNPNPDFQPSSGEREPEAEPRAGHTAADRDGRDADAVRRVFRHARPPSYASGATVTDPDADADGQQPFGPFKPPDAASLLNALRRRWVLALTLSVVAAVAGSVGTWLLLPPAKFLARTMLHVASVPPSVLGSSEPRPDFNDYKRTQQAMIKSRPVLLMALREPKVADLTMIREQPDPVEWLEKELKSDYFVAPEILTLSLKGDRSDELVVLVNAIADAYLKEIIHKEDKARLARLDRLQELYNKFDESVRTKRATLISLAKNVGSNDSHVIAVQHEFALKRLNQTETELITYQSELRKMDVELRSLQAREKVLPDLPISDAAIADASNKDPVVERQLEKMAAIERSLRDVERVAAGGKDSRAYRQRLRDLEEEKYSLGRRREQLRPVLEKELREQAARETHASIQSLQERIGITREHEKVLKGLVDLLTRETRQINESSLDLETLRNEIGQAEDMTKKIGGQMEALKVELLAPARIDKMEAAVAVPTRDKKIQVAATCGAGAGAFLLALLVVAYCEFRVRRIHSLDEVIQGLGLPLVGALPAMPRGQAPDTGDPHADGLFRYNLTESVDTARTMLLHSARAHKLRVVMIASAQPGEGKTSLSVHLAVSLARGGRRTLLIDGDLRNPSAHQVFNLEEGPGFNEIVRGETDSAATIRATPVPGLWMIPAGQWNAATTTALAQDAVRPLLDRLRTEFDFIICDSSPVLAAVDALLIGQQVDAAIFSILHSVSRSPSVHAAQQRMEKLGIPVLGAVVNGVTDDQDGYGYGYGYGYGKKKNGTRANSVNRAAAKDKPA